MVGGSVPLFEKATDLLINLGGYITSIASSSSQDDAMEDVQSEEVKGEEKWQIVDFTRERGMSLHRNACDGNMGIYYDQRDAPSPLESNYQRIYENIANYDETIASRLMEPFQKERSSNETDAWLNDSTVEMFFKTLEQSNKKLKIVCLDPACYPNFIESQKQSNRMRNLLTKLKEADLIFWPINQSDHWYLLLIERVRNNIFTIKCLDGYNHAEKHKLFVEKGQALLEKIHKDNHQISEDKPSYFIPCQDNAIDCGTVICYYAHKKAQGQDLNLYQNYNEKACSYVQFRLYMARQLEAARVIHTAASVYLPSYCSAGHAVTEKEKEKVIPSGSKKLKAI